jgi:hypothetical protein
MAIVRPDGTLYHWSVQTAPFGRAKAAELAGNLKYVIENDYPVRGTLAAWKHIVWNSKGAQGIIPCAPFYLLSFGDDAD